MDTAEGYRFNSRELKKWLKHGGKGSKERLCFQAKISRDLLDKLISEAHLPTGRNLCALADVMRVPLDRLVVGRKMRKS
jgi:hypothetical protein